MVNKITKLLLPSLVGVSVYLLINKLFPEEMQSFDKDPMKSVRGGGNQTKLFTRLLLALTKDRALQIALLASFSTAGITFFYDEIITLLTDDVFNSICIKDREGNLQIVCDMVEEYELKTHTTNLKEIIVAKNLTNEHKIELLKIKLDFIINGEYTGKRRFLLVTLLGIILTFTISGVGGLALILEALYRLFQEGRISRAIYAQIVKLLSKRLTPIPLEQLEHLNS